MPLYTTLCSECAKRQHIFRRIADRDSLPDCECGGYLSRIIEAPTVRGDLEPYVSPASGKLINSYSARRDDMKRGGYIDFEPGLYQHAERKRKENLEKAIQPALNAVDDLVTAMNVTGKLETQNAV